MKKCSNCGSRLTKDDEFCPSCGKKTGSYVWKILGTIFAIYLLFSLLGNLFGGQTTKYSPPEKVESSQQEELNSETPITPSELEDTFKIGMIEPETPDTSKVQVLKVGDSVVGNRVKLTLNRATFFKISKQQYKSTYVTEPKSGHYAILDVTLENMASDETYQIYGNQPIYIVDQEGYKYDPEIFGYKVEKPYSTWQILQGMKARGELGFFVPDDAIDLKFIFNFDVLGNKVAVYDLTSEYKSSLTGKSPSGLDDCIELEPEVWYEVKEFSGVGSKVTESFKINSETWRYTLNCNELHNFFLNKKTEEYGIVGVDSQILVHCDQNGEPTYVHDGPGEYYFDYMITGSGSEWTIKVEARKTSCDIN